jgi:archaemetzincin
MHRRDSVPRPVHMADINLVSVGEVDPNIFEFLSVALNDSLALSCCVLELVIPIDFAFDSRRDQYNSMELLARQAGHPLAGNGKVLGITDVDLFIPILTFVFGQAQLRNRHALVSVFRLRQQFYGLPDSPDLFLERCEKEAIHELGHTFGLVHCGDYRCVMHFSNSIEQVDLKDNLFCPACTPLFQASLEEQRRLATAESTVSPG